MSLMLARIAQAHRNVAPPVTSARSWRINIAANNGNANTSVGEMTLASTAGGANLCSGGTAFANYIFSSGYAATYAFDGSLTTRWAADGTKPLPHILGYRLPSSASISEVKVSSWTGTGWLGTDAPKDFTVQSSTDSTTGLDGTWKDEWAVAGQTGWAQGSTRTFTRPSAGKSHRYWRIYIKDINNGGSADYCTLVEIELRGTVGGADLTTPSTPAAASSSYSGQSPALVIDNNTTTTWSTASANVSPANPCWLSFDLGTSQTVAQVAITSLAGYGNRAPKTFAIQMSDDNISWTPYVQTIPDQTGWTGGETRAFAV